MDNKLKELVSNEMKQLHSSILLDEIRDKVRRLKAYGVDDSEIEAAIYNIELLPKIVITKDYKIQLKSNKTINVQMEPLLRSVYLLFLMHPEGITLKCLSDYKDDLTQIYLKMRTKGLTARAMRSIEDVTNPTLNSINEKCTKINIVFKDLLPHGLDKFYTISGKRGEPKAISLPNDHVIWECDINESQGLRNSSKS